MVEVSAVLIFIIGALFGFVLGIIGIVIAALTYKEKNKEGKDGNKDRKEKRV